MSTVIEEPKTDKPLVAYSPAKAEIAAKKQEFALLTADTPKGLELCKAARAWCVSSRSELERRRNFLLDESRKYTKAVNSEAKEYYSLILEVEEPLDAKIKAVENEKKRLAAEKAEQAKAKIEAEQRIVDAERRRQEQAEFERQAKIKAEQAAKEQAERDRIAAAEEKRLEAIQPDVEKVHRFAAAIGKLVAPQVESKEAKAVLRDAVGNLVAIIIKLQEFKA